MSYCNYIPITEGSNGFMTNNGQKSCQITLTVNFGDKMFIFLDDKKSIDFNESR